jgi:K+/H+ antiporter YhaU regulatory subunit KhtT
VIRHFSRLNSDELPVVDIDNPRSLVGSVHRSDVVDAYHAAIMKEDLLGGMQHSMTAAQHVGHAQLAPGIAMCELELPSHWAGKNLVALDLRKKSGVEVLLVKRRDGLETLSMTPHPDLKLQLGDVLLLSGSKSALDRLTQS